MTEGLVGRAAAMRASGLTGYDAFYAGLAVELGAR
jgi:hypothetical protein